MPARNVDQVLIQNWTNMGVTRPVPRWSVDIAVKWTDLEGQAHEYAGTHYFPDELADIPLPVIRAFMEQMIMAKVRVTLGIDEWDNYL